MNKGLGVCKPCERTSDALEKGVHMKKYILPLVAVFASIPNTAFAGAAPTYSGYGTPGQTAPICSLGGDGPGSHPSWTSLFPCWAR